MLKLSNVTLLGLDCVDLERLRVARDICIKDIEFGAVKILSSIESDDKDLIEIEKVDSLEKYSEFMIKKLTDYVETEFVLIFQHDGFVLEAENWRDEFFDYDYLGAPWIGYFKDDPDYNVGNGGFSLRSKKLLDILANDDQIEIGRAEDVIICRQYRKQLEDQGIKFAPEEVAGGFAIPDLYGKMGPKFDFEFTDTHYRRYLMKQGFTLENKEDELIHQIPEVYEHGGVQWSGQFGFHYLTKAHVGKWLEQNPEFKDRLKVEE